MAPRSVLGKRAPVSTIRVRPPEQAAAPARDQLPQKSESGEAEPYARSFGKGVGRELACNLL